MKKNKKISRKTTPVQVPSSDPAVLNRDLLNGFADDPMRQGTSGWAFREIGEFINKAFPVGHNPLETLRKVLPQWKWSIAEVAVEVDPWEGEIGHPAYCSFCSYCGNGKGPKGSYGEEQLLAQWTYPDGGRVFWIQATRPVKGLGFVAKTENGQWHFVSYRTEVLRDGAERNGWNYQPYPPGHQFEVLLKGKEGRFAPFGGFIPHGTRPVPVEFLGKSRDWHEGAFPGSGEWGRSGYEQDYVLPDGKVVTKSVCTDEWP